MKAVTIGGLVMLAIWGALIVGWVLNVIAVVHNINLPVTGMFVLRCIGILIAPLGGVLGLFF